jgi:hypothetical protein
MFMLCTFLSVLKDLLIAALPTAVNTNKAKKNPPSPKAWGTGGLL